MNEESSKPGRGLNGPGQAEIEERALELAREAGRDAMNAYDLAIAREDILGKKSTPADEDVEEPGADEPGEAQPS